MDINLLAGYVWFEFPKPFPDQATSSGDNFKDSCFLVTSLVKNFPNTLGLRFCDIGLADQMNNRVWSPDNWYDRI